MIKIILAGVSGAMGKKVIEAITDNPSMTIIAGIDRNTSENESFPIYRDINEIKAAADCIIDFSHYTAVDSLVNYSLERKIPIVICTTGLTDGTEKLILAASKSIPIFRSGNMSLGINLLIDLARKAASFLGDGFDIEIIEKHHNKKVDAPSGTAKMLAEGINNAIDTPKTLCYGRFGNESKRSQAELTIHAVRGGTIVGEHEVIFAGIDEVITLSHSAQSKMVFAKGAVNAAKFLIQKPAGLYDMQDMINKL